jgi:hypothetical protein
MSGQEEFKKFVQECIDLDNQIKQANGALKTLRNRKTSLQGNINTFMMSNKIDEVKLQDCKLKCSTSTSRASLTKDIIYQRLVLLCNNDEKQAQAMCDFICDPEARPKTSKPSLRRINNRKKKN